MVLDILQLAAELLQLRALPFVTDGDIGFERRFVVEPFVFVHLVGSDRRLDRAFQFHPRDVAVVVVVGQESVGAFGEKRLERRLAGEPRRLAQKRCGARELALILEAVGHEAVAAGGGAADDGEETGRARAVGFGQRLNPALEVRLRRVNRIEVRPLRLGRRARHEHVM